MKHYSQQNYYELLEVSPQASMEEITKAYRTAQEAFQEDSVAIYSLFDTTEEREHLLALIQEAYRTLTNGRTRREYDRELGLLADDDDQPTGQVMDDPDEPQEEEEEPQGLHLVGQSQPVAVARNPLPPLIKSSGEPLTLKPGETISGRDLARLRESRGVGLEELAERIRIKLRILEDLEQDHHDRLPALVYVKGFLKAYARALHLDQEALTQAYLSGMKTG